MIRLAQSRADFEAHVGEWCASAFFAHGFILRQVEIEPQEVAREQMVRDIEFRRGATAGNLAEPFIIQRSSAAAIGACDHEPYAILRREICRQPEAARVLRASGGFAL